MVMANQNAPLKKRKNKNIRNSLFTALKKKFLTRRNASDNLLVSIYFWLFCIADEDASANT